MAERGDVATTLSANVKAQLASNEPKLLIVFASPEHPLAPLMKTVGSNFPTATLLGVSSSGEFTEKGDRKAAASIFALSGDYEVVAGMGKGLKANPEKAVADALASLPRTKPGFEHCTAVLLLDPLAGNGEETTLAAAALLGEGVRLAGGAAGDDLKMTSTEVGLGTEAASDAVVIALIFSKKQLGVGVSHGHAPLAKSGPLRVTKSAGNVVSEIENRPAWDVWLEKTGVKAPAKEDEGAFLLMYEAGLAAGDAYKIRAPLSRSDDGSINFACGIPEGAVVRITESTPARQVESAREAARRARAQLGGNAPAGALVFDCICRNLILKEDFASAVRGMSEELSGAPLAGFETYGEIALDVGDMSGFHNTTSVVLAFPK
ncbi:MAG: FIST N-terminal domain-containing protein [Polyangiaceae bacterium]